MRGVPFPKDVLDLLDRTKEVDVETHSGTGRRNRVPIWVVVDGDDVFVRSWLGAGARWYRDIVASGGTLWAGTTAIPVRALRAVDAESIRRTSDGFKKKYPKSKSTPAMVRDEILDTTIRLEPAG